VRASVLLRTRTGMVSLGPGDLIGRSWCASLHLDDPRISEAHAMVSLRGERLRLLSLRGRFECEGRVVTEIDLEPGQRLRFAPEVELLVLDVVLPAELGSLEGDGLNPTILPGSCALVTTPEPRVVAPAAADAVAWLWPRGDGWRLRTAGPGEERDLAPGDTFEAGGRTFRFSLRPLASAPATREGLGVAHSLKLVLRYETAHVHRTGQVPVVIDGIGARMIGELHAFGVPVSWQTLTEQLWPGARAELARKRFDGVLARVRATLREGGLRADLVRSNGLGQFELFLEPGDEVEDQQ
jgi:hypothetical protein